MTTLKIEIDKLVYSMAYLPYRYTNLELSGIELSLLGPSVGYKTNATVY